MQNLFKITMVILILVGALTARPYNGDQFDFKQPDGSVVPVKLYGDEFYIRAETNDGFTVVRGDDGWIRYVDLNSAGSAFVPAEVYRATGSASRSFREKHLDLNIATIERIADSTRQMLDRGSKSRSAIAPLPMVGTFKGVTIIVDFSDRPGTISSSTVENFLNSDTYAGDGNVSSAKKWFSNVSSGKLNYSTVLYGYYRAKHPFSYYDDQNVNYGQRASELIQEALADMNAKGFDFSSLTMANGSVPLNLFYAGGSSGTWAKGMWPHQSQTSMVTYGGKTFSKYQITDMGSKMTLGTFVHENGHMLLGYPDLYSYVTGGGDWIKDYCTMGLGSVNHPNNPHPYNPYFQELSGWITPQDLTGKTNMTVSLTPSDKGGIAKVTGGSSEHFYIDARNKTGHAGTFPNSGVLIWHVLETSNNTNTLAGGNPLLKIVEADNNNILYQSGDFFTTKNGAVFTNATAPSSKWYNGTTSGLAISNLQFSSSLCKFDLGTGGTSTTYDLTVNSGLGDGKYEAGMAIEVTADAIVNKIFDKWTGDIAGLADATKSPTILTMGAKATTITATYTDGVTLTVNRGVGGGTYKVGSKVTIIADQTTPDSIFAGWIGDISGIVDPTKAFTSYTIGTTQATVTASYKSKSAGTTYAITVNSGTGSGSFATGTQVTITADAPAAGKTFDRWTGDANLLADSTKSTTTLTVGTKEASVTALYKSTVVLDTSKLSVNLLGHSGWESGADEYGSISTIDTSDLTKKAEGKFSTVADDIAAEKYSWAKMTSYLAKALTGVTLLKVTYTSDKPVTMVLEQTGLSEAGTAYGFELPAGTNRTEYLTLDQFKQPSWITTAQKAALDLTQVKAIGFEAVSKNAATTIAVTELKAQNYVVDPVGVVSHITKFTALQLAGISSGNLNLQIPTAGTYAIAIYSLTGRQLFRETRSLSAGAVAIPSGLTNSGIYLISVEGAGFKGMFKGVVR